MDVQLARTFLEIVSTGNFQSAAERLFVTQSAVSLRVKRMEAELGQTLFLRSKAGAQLTPAGEQFARFARSLLRVWEEAKHQVAVPDGFDTTLLVAAQYSLWPDLGLRWLRLMERVMPQVAFRADVGQGDRLQRLLADGLCDVALLYAPQLRPGLNVEPIFEDQLVLVSPDPDFKGVEDTRYVFMDWSPEFQIAHKTQFPGLPTPRVSLALGSQALDFVIETRRGGYFPARSVTDLMEAGELHLDADAPAFPFPAYAVSQAEGANADAIAEALRLLRAVADKVEDVQSEVLEEVGVETFDTSMSAEVGVPEEG